MLDYAIDTVLFARAPGGGLAPPGTRQLARSSRAHKSGVRPVAGVPDTRAPAADPRGDTRETVYFSRVHEIWSLRPKASHEFYDDVSVTSS